MSEPTTLVQEHLRALRTDLSDVKAIVRETNQRIAHMDSSLAALRRDQASDAERVVAMEARLDRLRDDLERVKRRLDLVD